MLVKSISPIPLLYTLFIISNIIINETRKSRAQLTPSQLNTDGIKLWENKDCYAKEPQLIGYWDKQYKIRNQCKLRKTLTSGLLWITGMKTRVAKLKGR